MTSLDPRPATLTPPTFPLRPVNGGPLEKAQPKHGKWFWQPKYNGWRATVHVPTGTMFNREGKRLSIERDFSQALALLRKPLVPEWLDVEALERRHNIGRGTLIVLDALIDKDFEQRHWTLQLTCGFPVFQNLNEPMANNSVYLVPSYPQKNREEFEANHSELQLWSILKQCNDKFIRTAGAHFYEGLVAKRADSKYPFQLRSPSQEFPFWMKHRWQF